MFSCEKQEKVQSKVKFKHNFRLLFFWTQCNVLLRMFSRYGAVAHFRTKFSRKCRKSVSRSRRFREFHDNLDGLVVVCPGVYTSILTAPTVIAQVDAQLNPTDGENITSNMREKRQGLCQSRLPFIVSIYGDFDEHDASPCGAMQRWRNTSLDVEALLLLLQELGHRVWTRHAKCCHFSIWLFSVDCKDHVEINLRSARIFLAATIPLPHESNRGSPAWSSYSSSMRALVGLLNPHWFILTSSDCFSSP